MGSAASCNKKGWCCHQRLSRWGIYVAILHTVPIDSTTETDIMILYSKKLVHFSMSKLVSWLLWGQFLQSHAYLPLKTSLVNLSIFMIYYYSLQNWDTLRYDTLLVVWQFWSTRPSCSLLFLLGQNLMCTHWWTNSDPSPPKVYWWGRRYSIYCWTF